MFRQAIQTTALDNYKVKAFPNITGDIYNSDISFVSTLKALLHSRMKAGEKVQFRIFSASPNSLIHKTSNNDFIDSLMIPSDGGKIHLVYFIGNEETEYEVLKRIEENYLKFYPEWKRLEKVTEFYRKTFNVLCFVNTESKNVVLYCSRLDIRKYHYLQCSILAFMPWYFNPEDGLSELEMELIDSLKGTDASKYLDAIAKIAKPFDFRAEYIKSALADFETRAYKQEANSVRRKIADYISQIEDYNRSIANLIMSKGDLETKLMGLECRVKDEDEAEIMDYFLRNKSLYLDEVSDNMISFSVKSYLETFDESMAENIINNRSSYVYRPDGKACNNIIPAEDMKKLMTAVFLEHKIKMRFCAAYRLSLRGRAGGSQYHSFDSDFNDYMPNPHVNSYACIGNYERVINELILKCDYIGAIEQCIASCNSLNLGDATVLSEFMRQLYGLSSAKVSVNTKCFELPDGSVVTPVGAIEWLKAQEKEEANENE